ncbi:MAG: DoxX family protein [Planctomycetaceae bacterium]|nr:DoxX family protein [Planctomycetaceae bacterium]
MKTLHGPLSLAGRLMIVLIYFLSAVGNKIPQFSSVTQYMTAEGVPAANVMLVGAIAFLIAGSLSVATGFRIRIGASLLLIFLVLATYFFHDFWTFEGGERQTQMIQFMKNVSLAGSLVFLLANGGGAWSLEKSPSTTE